MKSIAFIIVIVLGLFAHRANAQNHFSLNWDSVAALKRKFASMPQNDEPGFALLVAYKDSVILKAFKGVANVETTSRINDSTRFYTASVAKTWTAAAVLKLRQQGLINLSDRITRYLPDVPAAYSDVRIYHLLTHMSGIVDYYDVLGEDLSAHKASGILKFIKTRDSLLFEPGVNYSYSNSGYILLCEIVEQVSRRRFTDYVRDSILLPAGMKNTIPLDNPGVIIRHRAIGYKKDSLHTFKENDYQPIFLMGSGGYYSTIDDLHKWIVALKKGTVISPRSFDLMVSFPITLSGRKSYLGMGWNNESWGPKMPGLENLKAYGSFGVLNGFRSMIFYLPDNDLHLILLSNRGEFGLEMTGIIKTLLTSSIPKGTRP